MSAGFDIGAAIADLWTAAKQAGPFGCMLLLLLLIREQREHKATRTELSMLHVTRAEELKGAVKIAEDNVSSNNAILEFLVERLGGAGGKQ